MALPATDAFATGSNQTLTAYSASWTNNSGGAQVLLATGDVKGSTSAENLVHWNADTFANDQYCQTSVSSAINGNDCGPACRAAASAETAYITVLTTGGSELYKVVAGAFTSLGSNATVVSVADVMRIEASGTSISLKRNGSAFLGAFTDSAIASGSGGMWFFFDISARLDNFEAGNLGGAATKSPPILHRAYRMWKKRR